MNLRSKHVSIYIKEEFAHMQVRLAPYVKKSMTYGMIAVPLILFSLFNLYAFLFGNEINNETMLIVGAFAFLSSFGIALLKEAMYQNRQMVQASVAYMMERIKSSEAIPDHAREKYLIGMERDQGKAYQIFYEFLLHEERVKSFDQR